MFIVSRGLCFRLNEPKTYLEGQLQMTVTWPPSMETTLALVHCARAAGFHFGKDSAIVAVQHMLWQTVDLFRAIGCLAERPQNILALGKVYSNAPEVIRTLRALGVTIAPGSEPPPGHFDDYFKRDVRRFWRIVHSFLSSRDIKRIIVLDDGGECIKNTPPDLMRRYAMAGVEQTSQGIAVFEERPPPYALVSWARAAVKLHIGGSIFSHQLITNLHKELLQGQRLQGKRAAIMGLGSIGGAMARLLLRNGNKVVFFDRDRDLRIPQDLQGRITRSDSIEQLMTSCEYVFGCTGRDPFRNRWPMRYRPGIKLISGSSGDQEFGPIIRDLRQYSSFKVDSLTLNITCDGPWGPIFIPYQGYPYNFIIKNGEAVPTRIVQLETGGLLAALIQARIHLALSEEGVEKNAGIHRVSPESQRFVYETWTRAMKKHNINIRERFGYDDATLSAARHNQWYVHNSEPNPAAGYEPNIKVENAMKRIMNADA
jgi:hypothetical protein